MTEPAAEPKRKLTSQPLVVGLVIFFVSIISLVFDEPADQRDFLLLISGVVTLWWVSVTGAAASRYLELHEDRRLPEQRKLDAQLATNPPAVDEGLSSGAYEVLKERLDDLLRFGKVSPEEYEVLKERLQEE